MMREWWSGAKGLRGGGGRIKGSKGKGKAEGER